MDTQKIECLREIVHTTPALCVERGYLMTQSYKETEGSPEVIRRAEALKKILSEMSIGIDGSELIVGKGTGKAKAGPLLPEVTWVWYMDELDTMSKRETEAIVAWTEEERSRVIEIMEYWKGKSLHDKFWPTAPEEYKKTMDVFWLPGPGNALAGFHLAHCCPGFDRIITQGVKGLRNQVQQQLDKEKSKEKSDFYRAVLITFDALETFAGRYADLSAELAKTETDPKRKIELEKISEICRKIPANPAETFQEALQSLWFAYMAAMLEGYGPGLGFGRIDQYLYPFYRNSIANNQITREEALDLLILFMVKMNELVMPFPSAYSGGSNQSPLSVLTIGGITPEGEDAVNDLSYLLLDAEEAIRLHEDIAVRYNENTPQPFLIKAVEIARLVKGKIKFVSDETIVQQLQNSGKPIEHARDYGITGCFIRNVPGRSFDNGSDALNPSIALELALNNGVARLSGKELGLKTGDPRKFTSYEEVWDAYKKQLAALIKSLIQPKNDSWKLISEYLASPFISSLFDSCIVNGKDFSENGKDLKTTVGMWVTGIPTIGDSLAALKKVIFEEKRFTMSDLIDALDSNFENNDALLKSLSDAPKFGNDIDFVDEITNDVLNHLVDELALYEGFEGNRYVLAAGSVGTDMVFGKETGALPDGRKAGEALSDGGISPYYGRDVNGPTSTMRSVSKLDLTRSTGGNVLNMKFHPDLLNSDANLQKFVSMLRTFGATGGDLVQFNIISGEILREAQKHPEDYRDLLVRVATFSSYFVELSKEMQDQIIARTEFQEL